MDLQAWAGKSTDVSVGVLEERRAGRISEGRWREEEEEEEEVEGGACGG